MARPLGPGGALRALQGGLGLEWVGPAADQERKGGEGGDLVGILGVGWCRLGEGTLSYQHRLHPTGTHGSSQAAKQG